MHRYGRVGGTAEDLCPRRSGMTISLGPRVRATPLHCQQVRRRSRSARARLHRPRGGGSGLGGTSSGTQQVRGSSGLTVGSASGASTRPQRLGARCAHASTVQQTAPGAVLAGREAVCPSTGAVQSLSIRSLIAPDQASPGLEGQGHGACRRCHTAPVPHGGAAGAALRTAAASVGQGRRRGGEPRSPTAYRARHGRRSHLHPRYGRRSAA